jgi:hypothetical protein
MKAVLLREVRGHWLPLRKENPLLLWALRLLKKKRNLLGLLRKRSRKNLRDNQIMP